MVEQLKLALYALEPEAGHHVGEPRLKVGLPECAKVLVPSLNNILLWKLKIGIRILVLDLFQICFAPTKITKFSLLLLC
jgi:hypothetical protein